MYGQFQLMNLFHELGFSAIRIGVSTFENTQLPEYGRGRNGFFFMMDIIRRHDVIRETVLPPDAQAAGFKAGDRVYHFTELGGSFLDACRPPKP
jgi:hypothetical protein